MNVILSKTNSNPKSFDFYLKNNLFQNSGFQCQDFKKQDIFFQLEMKRIHSPSSLVTCPLYSGTNGLSASRIRVVKHNSSFGQSFLSIVPGSGPALKLP